MIANDQPGPSDILGKYSLMRKIYLLQQLEQVEAVGDVDPKSHLWCFSSQIVNLGVFSYEGFDV